MTESSDRGHFALVAYLPEPLASFLNEMCRNVSDVPCPQPHVTILPPRPLRVPVESACQTVHLALQSQRPFEIELSHVSYFVNTNTLYLDINDGASELHALHRLLNHGDLFYHEEFAFRPHVTIAGLISSECLPAVLQQAETNWHALSCSPRFTLSEVVCLLQDSTQTAGHWQRLWSVKLNSLPPGANERTEAASVTGL